MKKILPCLLATTLSAFAAESTFWSVENERTMTYAYIYDYAYPNANAASVVVDTSSVIAADFSVDDSGKDPSGAGFAFIYKTDADYKEVNFSLSAYKGLCITYKAEQPFRVDFKQATITDDNFYGADLPAVANFKSVYLAFADLKQGWKGTTTVAWSAAAQRGIQFSYKDTHVEASKVNDNHIEISSMVFTTEGCPSFAPVLLPPYSDDPENSVHSIKRNENVSLPIFEIFEDKDGDELDIKIELISSGDPAKILKYEQVDKNLIFTPITAGEVIVVLSANDGTHDPVDYITTINISAEAVPPVAVKDAYTTDENKTLVVDDFEKGVLFNDYDVDNLPFALTLANGPAHGTLYLDIDLGTFTYIPDAGYNGTDTWTYTITQVGGTELSATGTVTIVVNAVNDKPVVAYDETAEVFTTVHTYEEDFGTASIMIPASAVSFSDPDGDALTMGIASQKGIVSASLRTLGTNYVVTLNSIEDAYGEDTLLLYAKDAEDSVGVPVYIEVTDVIDPPVAVADAYVGIAGEPLNVDAKTGVLANDKDPDGNAIEAALVAEPQNGILEFDVDGAFVYTPSEGFAGVDTFSYKLLNSAVAESEEVEVQITIHGIFVVADIDTIGSALKLTEDATTTYSYLLTSLKSLFESTSGNALTAFSAESADGKLQNITLTTTGLRFKVSPDSSGEAVLNISVTDTILVDKKKVAITQTVPATFKIAAVDDKPKILKYDTLYVEGADWTAVFDLADYVVEVDGEELTYTPNLSIANSARVEVALEGSKVFITAKEGATFTSPIFSLGVKVADPGGKYVTVNLNIGFGAPQAIRPVMASTLNWRSAIQSSYGVAKIYDLSGRLMWRAKLPVDESAVKNAAAQVQGRKILQVNHQTWTLK